MKFFIFLAGLRPYDNNREKKILRVHIGSMIDAKIEDLIDKSLEFDDKCLTICKELIQLGRFCTANDAHSRPDMVFVLKRLETIKQ